MVEQKLIQLNTLVTHPDILDIKERLLGDMQIRSLSGNSITPLESIARESLHIPSRSARSEQILSLDDKEHAKILGQVLRNSYKLYSLLIQLGSDEFLDEPNFLLTRDRDTQYIDFFASNPEFDLSYTVYYANLFEVMIDYTKVASLGRRPKYRSGKVPIKTEMTKEEAEIVNFYMGAFLERHPFIPGASAEK
jgi:hypothetical protein